MPSKHLKVYIIRKKIEDIFLLILARHLEPNLFVSEIGVELRIFSPARAKRKEKFDLE